MTSLDKRFVKSDIRRVTLYLNTIGHAIVDAIYSPCLFKFIGIPNHASHTSNDSTPGKYPSNNIHAT